MSDIDENYSQSSGPLILSEVNAKDRSEMVCPTCEQYSVEEHPGASDYPSKKARIIKGSQCGNPNCSTELISPDMIERQYQPETITQKIKDPSNFLFILLVMVVAVVVGSYAMGIPIHEQIIQTPEATVSGTLVSPSGDPVENATLEFEDSEHTIQTNSSGEFTAENVEVGSYTLKIVPSDTEESENRQFKLDVELTEEEFNVEQDYITENIFQSEGLTADISFPSQREVNETFEAQDSTYNLYYLEEQNIESANVEITRLDDQDLQTTDTTDIPLNGSESLTTQGDIIDAELRGYGLVVEDEFTHTRESSSEGIIDFSLEGSLQPENISVSLADDSLSQTRSEEYNLANGESETVSMETVVGDANLRIRGGNDEAPETSTGTVDNTIDFTISETDAPSTVQLTLFGSLETEEQTEMGQFGTSEEDTVTTTPDGSISPRDAQILIGSGRQSGQEIDSQTISLSGESGTESISRDLHTVEDDSGTYSLEYDIVKTQTTSLASAGFEINGERTELSEGDSTVELDVAEGDTISIWGVGEQQSFTPVEHSTDYDDLVVTEVEASSQEIEVGEGVGLRAVVENQGNSDMVQSEEVVAYIDGETHETSSVQLDAGESEEVVFDNRVEFSESGVYPFQVNNSSITTISVGEGNLDYGEVQVEGTLNYTTDEGTVEIDTNNDGRYDCEVTAGEEESCGLSLDNTSNDINVRQNNVVETQYEISYTDRYAPQGIGVDMNGDGSNEINRSSPLLDGDTVSETRTFPEGSHTITVSVDNNESLDYELEKTQSGVISDPTVTINGTEVVSENESYQGERSYDISSEVFNAGSNTIELQTDDNATHVLTLDWSEQGESTAPQLVDSDGELLCTESQILQSCSISESEFNSGTNRVQLLRDGNPVPNAEATVSYTAKDVPSTMTLSSEESDFTADFDKNSAQETSSNGEWTHRVSRTTLPVNEPLQLTTETESALTLDGSVTAEYTAQREQPVRPKITVETESGQTEEFSVSETNLDENGELVSDATIEIPEDALDRGENTIQFTSSNDGVYQVTITGVQDEV